MHDTGYRLQETRKAYQHILSWIMYHESWILNNAIC
jgi:hypothetical protein